jgi:hypothetical protein
MRMDVPALAFATQVLPMVKVSVSASHALSCGEIGCPVVRLAHSQSTFAAIRVR